MKVLLVATIVVIAASAGCHRGVQTKPDVAALEAMAAKSKIQPAMVSPTPKRTGLSGTVFYRKKSGDSVILRGLTVYLFTPEEAGVVPPTLFLSAYNPADTLNLTIRVNATGLKSIWPYRVFDNDRGRTGLREIDGLLRKIDRYLPDAHLKAVASIDGRYDFGFIPSGKYYLFAMVDTLDAKGFWYFPVEVTDGQVKFLELNNSNITAIFDASVD